MNTTDHTQKFRFNHENAREFGLKGIQAKRERKERLERLLASLPANADENTRYQRILRQIDQADEMMVNCSRPDLFAKLVSAKDTLYHMIFPRTGSMRPKRDRHVEMPTIDAQDWQPLSKTPPTPETQPDKLTM